METKRFNYLEAIWQSFFSPALYADVGLRWRGVGFLYLLLIVIISWVPDLAKMEIGAQEFGSSAAEGYLQQLPAINITDGVASASVDTPYFIKDPKTGEVDAIIDFTGKYTDLDNTTAKMLLMRKSVIMKQSKDQTKVYSLAGVKNFSLDQEHVRHWIHLFVTWIVVVMAPIVIIFTYAFRIVQALIYAALGMAFASSFRLKLTYGTLVRITCVALTPVIIFTMATDLIPMHRTFPRTLVWLVHIAIAVIYLRFGVKACVVKPDEPAPTPLEPSPLA